MIMIRKGILTMTITIVIAVRNIYIYTHGDVVMWWWW